MLKGIIGNIKDSNKFLAVMYEKDEIESFVEINRWGTRVPIKNKGWEDTFFYFEIYENIDNEIIKQKNIILRKGDMVNV